MKYPWRVGELTPTSLRADNIPESPSQCSLSTATHLNLGTRNSYCAEYKFVFMIFTKERRRTVTGNAKCFGTSLAIQSLGLCTSIARGHRSDPWSWSGKQRFHKPNKQTKVLRHYRSKYFPKQLKTRGTHPTLVFDILITNAIGL